MDWGGEEVEGNDDGTEVDLGIYGLLETPDLIVESSNTPNDILVAL